MASPIRTTPVLCCAWCGRPGEVLHAAVFDRLFGVGGTWDIRRCPDRHCGLAWLDPMPAESDLAELYRNYFTHASLPLRARGWRRFVPPVTALTRGCFRWTPLNRARRHAASMYLTRQAPGRVLDVGCGNGDRLAFLRAQGWDVVGQEIDPAAARVATARHGVVVHVGRLRDIGLPPCSFDAITLSHVIEHVPDPVELLRACRRLAKPGGAIVCVTPNLDSWGHRRFRSCWLGLDPPRHLHLFSPISLRIAAERAGLTPLLWTTAANVEFIGAGSLDLTWQGFHRVGGGGRPHRDAVAALLQIAASARHVVDRQSGDECVLYATA